MAEASTSRTSPAGAQITACRASRGRASFRRVFWRNTAAALLSDRQRRCRTGLTRARGRRVGAHRHHEVSRLQVPCRSRARGRNAWPLSRRERPSSLGAVPGAASAHRTTAPHQRCVSVEVPGLIDSHPARGVSSRSLNTDWGRPRRRSSPCCLRGAVPLPRTREGQRVRCDCFGRIGTFHHSRHAQ